MRCSACTIEIPGASRFCLRCGARVGERTAVVSGKPDALEEGTEIAPHVEGRYRVLRLLGRGGMGAVYLAREDELDRLVALKTLRMGDERSEDARERFRREARAAARLNHPRRWTAAAISTPWG